jgi:alpha-maltose-1-phosphate synthase
MMLAAQRPLADRGGSRRVHQGRLPVVSQDTHSGRTPCASRREESAATLDAVSPHGLSPTRGVLVTHPGRQHAYRTVRAAEEAGVLQLFATGIFLDRGSRLDRVIRSAEAVPIARRALSAADGRRDSEIDRTRVVSFPVGALAARAVRRIPGCGEAWRIAEHLCDRRIARLLRALDPAPMIVHGFEGGCLATLREARRRGIATVLDVPSSHEYAQAVISKEGGLTASARVTEWIRSERTFADVLLAPSELVERCLLENGVPPSRIERLPYGVHLDEFPPVETRDGRAFRALFVGGMLQHKGVVYLLEAWRRLALPKAELVLIGGISKRGRKLLRPYDGMARCLGQLTHVETRTWFGRSDVFVFPSLTEGSALVTYEALASGLPVVTTPNSGSVVRDGIDGLIVPPCDIDGIGDALRLLYENPDLRNNLGASGRQLVESNYTWHHYRQRLSRVYERLAGC